MTHGPTLRQQRPSLPYHRGSELATPQAFTGQVGCLRATLMVPHFRASRLCGSIRPGAWRVGQIQPFSVLTIVSPFPSRASLWRARSGALRPFPRSKGR